MDSYLPSNAIASSGGITIQEHVLDFLLTMNHPEHADNPVPKCVSNLLVHIIDTHVDQLQDIVIKLEMDLDGVERELDTGGYLVKKEMLDDRRFPKMHLDLQRLLQVIAHGEQVFPRMKDKCAGKKWCTAEDIVELDVLVVRLRKLKENVGFIASRITAIQAGLDSWQAEQINRKLYYLSFLSMIFLPLSIVTGGSWYLTSTSPLYSLRDERWRRSLDEADRPHVDTWIPERNAVMCRISGYAAGVLCRKSPVFVPVHAKEKASGQEKMASGWQEVYPHQDWTSGFLPTTEPPR
ncbi:hypothetical protein R1sor_018311 [Riccia sorocarpa]|uniref:Uncharacterized protein n=1 Tax=Riccia sorocarpa TaxID=122646 RepID=A0ABD3ICL5_9MARC